jgi:hypothetical protein
MEAMDAPYRASDLLHGYQAVADNLPHPLIHQKMGSKKILPAKEWRTRRLCHSPPETGIRSAGPNVVNRPSDARLTKSPAPARRSMKT